MATLQKLLWSEEYSDFCEEVVLVESRFVLARKHGEYLCMVHAGLTETVVLIAEESVDPYAIHLRTEVVATDAPSNVEYLHLAHLFPLQNTRLSTRSHQEHRGEHVLRLRLSTGKTWYLELAEGRHREDRWREWLSWIHDLDERRHEKTTHPLSIEAARAPPVEGNLEVSTVDSQDSVAALAAAQQRKRRDSRAYHWVGHFGGALSRDHDGQILVDDHDIPTPGHLLEYSTHRQSQMSTAVIVNPTASLVWQPAENLHSLPVKKAIYSSTDTYSSLEDIESIASFVGETKFDWMHPVSDEINRKLVLCVGDLFQKFNMEAHGHGHVGRWRPLASLTAVDQLREADITTPHGERRGLPSIPTKEILHHRCSLPDVLEGEASFLDDMQPAADAAHRASLVYLDLANDDHTKTPHAIGGHVMLLSSDQTRLQEEIARYREMSADVEFLDAGGNIIAVTKKKGRGGISSRAGKKAPEEKTSLWHRRKKGDKSLKGKPKSKNHDSQRKLCRKQHADGKLKSEQAEHFAGRILHSLRKRKQKKRDRDACAKEPQQICRVYEIDPEVLARELTLLDSLLFIRVREAELVDCLWLKEDRHTRAPHTTRLIEFFERVVGLVSTEIVRPSTAKERAATVASFVLVAEQCLKLQNFHSLKAVLSGLKVLPVYRLRKTWQVFEEDFPFEYGLWCELVFLMADDGRSDLYKMAVRKSLLSPPCLPFMGTFLLSVVDLYSAVDRAGMRLPHRAHVQLSSSTWTHCYSSTDEDESTEQVVHFATDGINSANPTTESLTQPKPTLPAGFLGTFAFALHAFRGKKVRTSQSTAEKHLESSDSGDSSKMRRVARGMTFARKTHIRRLIINYAKQCRVKNRTASARKTHIRGLIINYAKCRAEERGMAWRAGAEPVTVKDLLGAAFFAGVKNPIDWGSLFAKVQPTGMQIVSKKEEEEKAAKKSAEYKLFETLFTYQMTAVQYTHESNSAVRKYLLNAEYDTDQLNFKLSMSREPPSD